MLTPINDKLLTFFSAEQKEARRIFHGRGHCFPGLEHICIDWFRPVVLISAWQEVEDPEALKEIILAADVKGQIKSIVLQNRFINQSPAETIYGDLPDKIIVQAQDLRFEVHPGRRQNAGLFLDMGPLREWLKENSAGCNVLNLFAYTCALSVAALAGGGKSVTNVDMSKPSLEWGLQNHMLNGQGPMPIKSIPHNLFKSWGRIKQFGRYDLVIIDPPTNQRGSFNAERNYKSVLKKMHSLCNPGASIIAALNSPFLGVDFLHDCLTKNLPDSKFIEMIPAADEFVDIDPERGLKIAHYQMPG